MSNAPIAHLLASLALKNRKEAGDLDPQPLHLFWG